MRSLLNETLIEQTNEAFLKNHEVEDENLSKFIAKCGVLRQSSLKRKMPAR